MAADAPPEEIRRAYRDRARRFHPDRGGDAAVDAATMSRINEAYRVLGEPGRRALYDRSLGTVDHGDEDAPSVTDEPESVVRQTNPLAPAGPARIPWKLMAVTAALGSGFVLVSAALSDPPSEEVPDGIIRVGSCVELADNGDAREVACTGDGDVVVELFLPIDAVCPVGLEPHRDRLGLGVACIEAS